MARYREKSPEDEVWDETRTRLIRALDTEFKIARAKALNKILPAAFDAHCKAVGEGELLEIEETYSTFAKAVVADVVADIVSGLEVVDSDADET